MPASLVLALEGVEAIEHVRDDGQGGPRNVVHEVVADRRDVYRPGGVADRDLLVDFIKTEIFACEKIGLARSLHILAELVGVERPGEG